MLAAGSSPNQNVPGGDLPSSSSRCVLFVDDDPLMIRAFGRVIRGTGITADYAGSGGEALDLAQRQEYPVVVTDLRMPGIDGIALIEQVSMMHPASAFVLMTADPNLYLYRSSGADAAIVSMQRKPWDVDELLVTLEGAFGLHRERLAMRQSDGMSAHLSLLLIEDDDASALLIEEYLAVNEAAEVRRVSCLHDALELLHERRFDVVMTDLLLPDARGLDSVIRVRAGAPDAAIVVCSGMNDDALALQMIQVGAHDYLSKNGLTCEALHRAIQFARQRKRAEQRLLRLAHCDTLTGLANRASFQEHLEHAVARGRRHHSRFAVAFLDLDGFKAVNDALGHDVGDMLLKEVAARLHHAVRPYDTVARFGGDEFAILLPDVSTGDQIDAVTERIVAAIGLPVRIGGQDAQITVSIGIAVYPDTTDAGQDLVRCADRAMYSSKKAGRNRVTVARGSAPMPAV